MKLVSIVVASLLALCAPFVAQEPKKPAAQETSLAAERRELAEIQLLVSAERKFAAATGFNTLDDSIKGVKRHLNRLSIYWYHS